MAAGRKSSVWTTQPEKAWAEDAVLSSAKLRFDMFLEKKSRWFFLLSWR
jgi:hypothetical protein